MEALIVYLVICGIIGVVAACCGRNLFGWFLIAFLLSPVLAVVLLIVLPPREKY